MQIFKAFKEEKSRFFCIFAKKAVNLHQISHKYEQKITGNSIAEAGY